MARSDSIDDAITADIERELKPSLPPIAGNGRVGETEVGQREASFIEFT